MNPRFLSTLLACASLAVGAFAADNTLSDAEKAAGWKLLFDGKSMTGWRAYKQPATQAPAGWEIKDGLLKQTPLGRFGTPEDIAPATAGSDKGIQGLVTIRSAAVKLARS